MSHDSHLQLNTVTYSRAHQVGRTTPITLIGQSRWIRDLELLLEDQWKNIRSVTETRTASTDLSQNPPRICIVEWEEQGQETLRLLESVIPRDVHRITLLTETTPLFVIKQMQRKISTLQATPLLLPAEAAMAALELSDILDQIVRQGLVHNGRGHEFIRSAYYGYQIASNGETASAIQRVARLLFSEFSLHADQLEAAILLLETHALWKLPKAADGELGYAYRQVEQELQGTPVIGLIQLAEETVRTAATLEPEKWEHLVQNCAIGKLAGRRLRALFPVVLAATQKREAKLKAVA